jgi:8-oxo-dGTP pyrophosphatase MutT (NUDIX family)
MTIETLSSREVYRNRWMSVREDRIRRPDGTEGIYGVVTRPDFALIIPRHAGRFYMIEQYRYPVRGRYLEFPQGAWETKPDAKPEDVAAGELREETGFTAGRMTYLGGLFSAYGFVTQKMHVYLAEDLRPGPSAPDPEEHDLVCIEVPVAEFEARLLAGQITDGQSVAAYGLLRAKGLG